MRKLLSEIAETGVLSDELLETMHAAAKAFKENWSDTPASEPQREEVSTEENSVRRGIDGYTSRNTTTYCKY